MLSSIRSKRISLSVHLLLFGLLCFLPALIALLYLGLNLTRGEQDRVRTQAQVMARNFQEVVKEELATVERILDSLATAPALQTADWERFQQQAEKVAAHNEAAIALRTPDGQQLVNTVVSFGSRPLPRTSDAVLLDADARALQSKRPTVSDLYLGAAANRYFVAVDVPVLRDGEVAYLLTMAIPPARLASRLRLGELAEMGWLATVIGRDGRVIARTRDPDRFVGKKVSEALTLALQDARVGTLRSVTLDGRAVHTSFQRDANDWTVVVSVPEDVLNAPVRGLLKIVSSVLLIVLGCTAFGAWTYGRFLGRELHTLATNAMRLGDRRTLVPFNQHIAEVSDAQAAMIDTSRRIEALVAELDHRVKNTLAIIISIVSRTVSRSRERAAIEGRVSALSLAHEALSASRWAGADLCELLTSVTKTYDLDVACDGPKVLLSPRTVVSLAQVFHELTSNAREHGALRSDHGSVTVLWRVGSNRLELRWRETAIAELPSTNYARGFGLKIVELCGVRQLGGECSFDAAPTGWTVTLRFPLGGELGPSVRLA